MRYSIGVIIVISSSVVSVVSSCRLRFKITATTNCLLVIRGSVSSGDRSC